MQAMDREVLKEMKQTLAEKTLEKLTLSNDNDVILPKEFCHPTGVWHKTKYMFVRNETYTSSRKLGLFL